MKFPISRFALALALILATLLAMPAAKAEIENLALVSEDKPGVITTVWWPRLPPLAGWTHGREESIQNQINLLVPDKESSQYKGSLIYAKATYKPRITDSNLKTLEQFIEDSKVVFLRSNPDVVVADAMPLATGDSVKVVTRTFTPTTKGRFERVGYFNENEYYITVVLTSRTKEDLEKAMPKFEELIRNYREKYPDAKKEERNTFKTFQLERKN